MLTREDDRLEMESHVTATVPAARLWCGAGQGEGGRAARAGHCGLADMLVTSILILSSVGMMASGSGTILTLFICCLPAVFLALPGLLRGGK